MRRVVPPHLSPLCTDTPVPTSPVVLCIFAIRYSGHNQPPLTPIPFRMLLGYAYPAFEGYKVVEKNEVDIDELRFWCQYWIVVAILSVLERVGDIFISWLPMYGEAKLAMFVYLWYPKVKGTGHVYGALLRPYIAKHENEIDRALMELRARAWDYFLFNNFQF